MTEAAKSAYRRKRFTPATVGAVVLIVMGLTCLLTLPASIRMYNTQHLEHKLSPPTLESLPVKNAEGEVERRLPLYQTMGTDGLGRSLLWRCALGGAISLGIGLTAAAITVVIGTTWGLLAGYAGGRIDATMMRIVDVLYGLPYILLVLLLVVAVEGVVDRFTTSELERLAEPENQPAVAAYEQAKQAAAVEAVNARALPPGPQRDAAIEAARQSSLKAEALDPRSRLLRFIDSHGWVINLGSLLVAIGSLSWLTLARVVRGQVLSLKAQPFVEAARAIGCPTRRILTRHVLPNLIGPIIVYTTLTVPQAILQESFLSFLGIGVRPPLPSWGNLAAAGLAELNPVQSRSWLLFWPCVLLAVTLLALNFIGDGLRDRFDPRAKEGK